MSQRRYRDHLQQSHLWLPADLMARVREKCQQHGLTITGVVGRLLREWAAS